MIHLEFSIFYPKFEFTISKNLQKKIAKISPTIIYAFQGLKVLLLSKLKKKTIFKY